MSDAIVMCFEADLTREIGTTEQSCGAFVSRLGTEQHTEMSCFVSCICSRACAQSRYGELREFGRQRGVASRRTWGVAFICVGNALTWAETKPLPFSLCAPCLLHITS